jgi:hypothetical protein
MGNETTATTPATAAAPAPAASAATPAAATGAQGASKPSEKGFFGGLLSNFMDDDGKLGVGAIATTSVLAMAGMAFFGLPGLIIGALLGVMLGGAANTLFDTAGRKLGLTSPPGTRADRTDGVTATTQVDVPVPGRDGTTQNVALTAPAAENLPKAAPDLVDAVLTNRDKITTKYSDMTMADYDATVKKQTRLEAQLAQVTDAAGQLAAGSTAGSPAMVDALLKSSAVPTNANANTRAAIERFVPDSSKLVTNEERERINAALATPLPTIAMVNPEKSAASGKVETLSENLDVIARDYYVATRKGKTEADWAALNRAEQALVLRDALETSRRDMPKPNYDKIREGAASQDPMQVYKDMAADVTAKPSTMLNPISGIFKLGGANFEALRRVLASNGKSLPNTDEMKNAEPAKKAELALQGIANARTDNEREQYMLVFAEAQQTQMERANEDYMRKNLGTVVKDYESIRSRADAVSQEVKGFPARLEAFNGSGVMLLASGEVTGKTHSDGRPYQYAIYHDVNAPNEPAVALAGVKEADGKVRVLYRQEIAADKMPPAGAPVAEWVDAANRSTSLLNLNGWEKVAPSPENSLGGFKASPGMFGDEPSAADLRETVNITNVGTKRTAISPKKPETSAVTTAEPVQAQSTPTVATTANRNAGGGMGIGSSGGPLKLAVERPSFNPLNPQGIFD